MKYIAHHVDLGKCGMTPTEQQHTYQQWLLTCQRIEAKVQQSRDERRYLLLYETRQPWLSEYIPGYPDIVIEWL